jgi:hypothetical protein
MSCIPHCRLTQNRLGTMGFTARLPLSELQLVEPGVPELPDQLNHLGLIATPARALEVMHPTPSPESEMIENHDDHRTLTLTA